MYNTQGDVVALTDTRGNVAATYAYDAWGNPTQIVDGSGNDVSNNATHVANVNPYRYRGYRYDGETGMYYLMSRYYSPEWGRFVNADDMGIVQGSSNYLLGGNGFAYCGNSPVMRTDPTGYYTESNYNWGIRDESAMPPRPTKTRTISNLNGISWATTGSVSGEKHCGPTAITNLALYFAARGKKDLKVKDAKGTFNAIYPKYAGKGPHPTIAGKAKNYFKSKKVTLNYSVVGSINTVKKAIDNNRPVGALLKKGGAWHWVICVGYRMYDSQQFYMRLVDGWYNQSNRFYKPHVGSDW